MRERAGGQALTGARRGVAGTLLHPRLRTAREACPAAAAQAACMHGPGAHRVAAMQQQRPVHGQQTDGFCQAALA